MARLICMAKPLDPEAEIVRANLIKFREEAKLSQADAANLSGVALDNLRRYESGAVTAIPSKVLRDLAQVYGHAMDDFYLESPPRANLLEAPHYFLQSRPGTIVDPEVDAEIRAAVKRANEKVRGKKSLRKESR